MGYSASDKLSIRTVASKSKSVFVECLVSVKPSEARQPKAARAARLGVNLTDGK